MPFDPSGNFTRTRDWTNDRDAAIKIRADFHDQNDDDIAAALSLVICKDGRSQVTADIPWNGRKITNLATPTAAQDAATKAYADAIRNFATSITLTGASTGVVPNQVSQAMLGFTEADMSIVGRNAGSPEGTAKRIAINDKADGTGVDVVTITETGQLTGAIFFIDRYYATTGSATWTKPTLKDNGVVPKYIEVWVQGGGAGGGGANASANNVMVGSGGGGGCFSHRVYPIADIVTATVAITIGAGGSVGPGTPGANGGDGGTSSFGGLSAGGGSGGFNTGNNAANEARVGGLGGSAAANADEAFSGSPGHACLKFSSPPYQAAAGAGGTAGCGGGGGRPPGSPAAGTTGDRGAGGSGGVSMNASGGGAGGAGGGGFVHVREWY